MKTIIQLILLCSVGVLFMAEVKAQEPKTDLLTVCYKTTMDCKDCQATLTNYLKFEKGVKDLTVDLKSNTIKVVYKSGKNSPENLVKGIKKLGYEAKSITEKEYKILIEESPGK